MAVRPILSSKDGSVQVWHDEGQHGATVTLADLKPGRNPDGRPNYRFTSLSCPVCGAVSLHPASGGCDPEQVQRLFAHLVLANPAIPARTWTAAKVALKQLVEDMDGPERWRLEDASESDE